jgi:uncharacterized repeat protein (TIGR01451 family)
MYLKLRTAIFISSLLMCNAILAQTASLSVEKNGNPNPVVAGTNITYSITISCEGPDDALNVVLDDPLPAGTTFVSLTSPPGWSCATPTVGSSGTVNCTRATFPPGSDFFTLVFQTDPSLATGSVLSNTATVSTTTSDPDQNDNVAIVNTPVEAHSDLGVTKSAAPDPAPIGGPATFTLGYSASGPSEAANVSISDILPAGTLFSSVSAPGWSCATPAVGTNGTVTCTIAALTAGASGTITIGVTIDSSVTAGTVITNTATITGDVVDGDSTNASASASLIAQHLSNLTIDKNAAPTVVSAGSTLTYMIDFSASGPSTAPNVVVTDVLPAQTTFNSLVTPGGWSCTTPLIGTNGTVNCTHPSVASGTTGTFTLIVAVDPNLAAGTTISNTATISGDVIENTSDNSATDDVTTAVVADIGLTKTAPATTFAGNAMSYSIDHTVFGPSQATNVTIADTLPAGTAFASITAPGFSCITPAVGANGTVSCFVAALPPNATGTITINVTINQNVAPSTVLSNTATVSSANDPNAGNDSSTATTTVSAPLVTGVKSISQATAAVGDTVTYTIVLHNNSAFSQGDNPGDEFTDVLPASLALVSATATSGTPVADIPNNTVHWNGSIPAGADVTITITATVLPGAAGTTVSNQGTIHFDGDNNGTNESTIATQAPGGGATVFAVIGAGIPTLSPSLLIALTMLLLVVGWRVAGR